jgi:hypothetical protein
MKSGINWYVYCKNNPLRYVDPTGLDSYGDHYSEMREESQRISDAYDAKEYENSGSISSNNFYNFLNEVRITHDVNIYYNFQGMDPEEVKNEFIKALCYLYQTDTARERITAVQNELRKTGSKITIVGKGSGTSIYKPGADKNNIVIEWNYKQGLRMDKAENAEDIKAINPDLLQSAAMALGHELGGHGYQDLVENKMEEYRIQDAISRDITKTREQRLAAEERKKDILYGPKDPRGVGPWPERTGGQEQDVVNTFEKIAIQELNEKYGAHEAIRSSYFDASKKGFDPFVNTKGVTSTEVKPWSIF